MITLELPFPPSVNTYWGSRIIGKGKRAFLQRYVNDAGKKFRQAVLDEFMVRNIRLKLKGPLACTVDLHPPCKRRRDVDNYCKGLFDSLGAAGLYDDDSQIVDMRVRMHPKNGPGRVVVYLECISAPQSAHNQIDLIEA